MAKFFIKTKLSENISETPEGYLLCENVPMARTGVMEYGPGETPLEVGEDGKVYIDREADEVFRPQTIASFNAKAVTIKHPEDFINPNNWKELAKGIIQNVRRGKDKDENGEEVLLCDLLITDAMAIGLVNNGLREVSCGYEAEYEQTGKGKGRQTNIIGNHLALVEEGRAGQSYAINDHKGKVTMSKQMGERIKALLGRTVDEAMAEEKKDDKAKDSENPKASKSAGSETNVVMDKQAYDELMKGVKDLAAKVEGMMKPKDEKADADKKDDEAKDDEVEEKKDDKKSEDDDMESEDEGEDAEILERVKALEAAVAKLLESKDEDMEGEGAAMEADDASEGEEGEESQKKTGDTKTKKKSGLEDTKNPKGFESFDSKKEVMTPEKLNELNAAHWARK